MDYLAEGLRNVVRDEVMRAVARFQKSTRHMVCDSYDPKTGCATGRFQPGGQKSGAIPVGTAFAGNAFGLAFPPSPGDVLAVGFQEGSYGSGVITHIVRTKNTPPPNAQSGEAWLQHKNGQTIKMLNDSTMTLIGQSTTQQLFDSGGKVIFTTDSDTTNHHTQHLKQGDNTPPKMVMLADGTVSKLLRAQNG